VDNDRSPLADTEVHYLWSAQADAEFKIFVGHCGTLAAERAASRAVLYLTDANGYFGLTVDLIRSLQLARHLPPLLVIGIGYRAGTIGETIAVRTKDLTPTSDPAFARLFPGQPAMGGAAAMLAFITDELMPWAGHNYGADPAGALYFGHSFGGLFGTYVLLREPAVFRSYIIASPSLWWDNYTIFKLEERYAQARDDLAATVYFGIGADETHEGRQREARNMPPDQRAKTGAWYIDMVADMTRLVAQLQQRQYPALNLRSETFPGEFHITVPPLALSRGLRYAFGAPR
jgi:predicted alpha/beta superfamily hydrolase